MKYSVNYEIEFRKHNYPGKFIAIEGIDGSGKTTQAQLLCSQLAKKGKTVYCTKEPTDLPTGKMIRDVLAGKVKMTAVGLQYLFNADRAEHQEIIIDHLKEGNVVVTDRYFWSSVAYAIADLEKVDDYYLTVFSLLSFYNRFLIPDMTFYLQINPKTAVERIQMMGKKKEIYENLEKLEKIQRGYKFLMEKFPEEFVIVDGSKSTEIVAEQIADKLLRILE